MYSYLRLYGYDRGKSEELAWSAIDRVGLREAAHRKAAGYSKGMRQRIRLAQSLAHNPRVLVLDEPLNGLDPLVRAETIALFRALAKEGCHVILSSHVLHEVDIISDQVILMSGGYVAAEGNIQGVRSEIEDHPMQILIRCDRPERARLAFFRRGPCGRSAPSQRSPRIAREDPRSRSFLPADEPHRPGWLRGRIGRPVRRRRELGLRISDRHGGSHAMNRLVWAQIRAIVRIEMKKTFFAKRGLWIYLLALAPVALFFTHSLVEIHQHGARRQMALKSSRPLTERDFLAIGSGMSRDDVIATPRRAARFPLTVKTRANRPQFLYYRV